jgi:hypothetical protein
MWQSGDIRVLPRVWVHVGPPEVSLAGGAGLEVSLAPGHVEVPKLTPVGR